MDIKEARIKIEAFELVPCGLYHELVERDANNQPVMNTFSEENTFQRIQLCPSAIRRKRLGCAHSVSNTNFNDILNPLAEQFEEIKELQTKANNVILNIYALDHKKGDLEKEVAEQLIGMSSRSKEAINADIKRCIADHTEQVHALQNIKLLLLEAMDLILLNSTSNG